MIGVLVASVAIAFVIVAALLGLALVVLAAVQWCRQRRRPRGEVIDGWARRQA